MSRPELERYEILDELGRGGMSVVYRARDRTLDREVALKVLHDALADQVEARRRFEREATAIARLHDPGIVEIFDYSGPNHETAYLVTELIEGVTLRRFVEIHGRPRCPEIAIAIVAEIVRALSHAHARDIIHRDLKPENIMVARSGQLKLMDFGIAQILTAETRLTLAGTLVGSPAHMAPEVIDGRAPDRRSDIYSIGTLLYWLATGRLPFEAPNPSALFRKILDGTFERPEVLEPRIGARLGRIIERCLARAPESRHQSATELHTDLIAELDTVGLTPPEQHLGNYLAAPGAFEETFEPALVDRLFRAGREAMDDGDQSRAVERLNRVLAISPNHRGARVLLQRVGRTQVARRWLRRSLFALCLTLLGFAALGRNASRLAAGPWPWINPEAARRPTPTPRLPPANDEPRPVADDEPRPVADDEPRPVADDEPRPVADDESRPVVDSELRPAKPLPAATNSTPHPLAKTQPSPASERAHAPSPSSRAPLQQPDPLADRTVARPPMASDLEDGAIQPARRATRGATRREALPAPTEPEPDRAPVLGRLSVRIGNAWVQVFIDGDLKAQEFYRGTFELAPGEHTIEFVKPGAGRYRPRKIWVTEDGRIFEVNGTVKRLLPSFGLEVTIPRPGDETIPKGWVAS
ncbi:MAG: protein kinase [Deltaproteobacteria bacterium]|nr:protein kinase [Deltaproteobacteria bacterium]